jgi:hypothetical protein
VTCCYELSKTVRLHTFSRRFLLRRVNLFCVFDYLLEIHVGSLKDAI